MSVKKDIEDKGEIIEVNEVKKCFPVERKFDKFIPKVLTNKQKSVIKALKKYRTNISLACEACRISRNAFNEMRKNPLFDQAVNDEINAVDDLIESGALKKALQEGDTTMLIFLLKTRLKHRGYVERTEQLIQSNQKNITYNVKDLSDEQLDILIKKHDENNNEDSG